MTRQTFYRALKKVAPEFKWKLNYTIMIRATKGSMYFCPITALYYKRTGKYLDSTEHRIAADYLNLHDSDNIRIAMGADGNVNKKNAPCRKALLRAVGLTKKNP